MTPLVLLAHGASGTAASMRPHVEGLRRRGLEASAVELPRGNAERAVPVFAARIGDHPDAVVIGGHSYGGRVASLLAAEQPVAGLVLLSYPLHRPGHPEALRTEHWTHIACPVLLLSGESDPFARVDLLRRSMQLLVTAELITYPGVRHGLLAVLDDALDQVARFVGHLASSSRRRQK
jgi:predicted alpha/beta-hydrolase family hydrolase